METDQPQPISIADILGGTPDPEPQAAEVAPEPVVPVDVEPDERALLYAEHDDLARGAGFLTVAEIKAALCSQLDADRLPRAC